MIAVWVRSKFRVMGPCRYCICGEPVDCLGDHVLCCPRVTVRNQVRNTAHASLSYQLRRCLSSHSASSEYVVAAGEPPLARYLESNLPVIHPVATDEDPWRAHDPTHPARRADLAVWRASFYHPYRRHDCCPQLSCRRPLDVLPRLAMLPKLPHMPATIVLPLMMCSFSSSQ